jgi:hypothetical protein
MALTTEQSVFLETADVHFRNLSSFISVGTARQTRLLNQRDLMLVQSHLKAAQQYLRDCFGPPPFGGREQENSDGRSSDGEPAGGSPENFTRPRPSIGIEEGSEISSARNGAEEVHES